MKIIEIVLIGVALAMDAFALTIANCTTYKKSLSKVKEWSMPTTFGLFQFLMPVIGFYIGSLFAGYITTVSKFIVFGIFFLLALKIVIDNVKDIKKEEICAKGNFSFGILIVQALATSIDALAVGITFAVQLSNPFLPSFIIGAVTFAIVAVALFIGKSLGKLLGKYATWAGAVILFALSVKSLIEALI